VTAPAAAPGWRTSPPGSRPRGAGPFGHVDLAGPVATWTLDWYAAYATGPCLDCASVGPAPMGAGAGRSVRGGNWFLPGPQHLPSAYRSGAGPAEARVAVGVRCARPR